MPPPWRRSSRPLVARRTTKPTRKLNSTAVPRVSWTRSPGCDRHEAPARSRPERQRLGHTHDQGLLPRHEFEGDPLASCGRCPGRRPGPRTVRPCPPPPRRRRWAPGRRHPLDRVAGEQANRSRRDRGDEDGRSPLARHRVGPTCGTGHVRWRWPPPRRRPPACGGTGRPQPGWRRNEPPDGPMSLAGDSFELRPSDLSLLRALEEFTPGRTNCPSAGNMPRPRTHAGLARGKT